MGLGVSRWGGQQEGLHRVCSERGLGAQAQRKGPQRPVRAGHLEGPSLQAACCPWA